MLINRVILQTYGLPVYILHMSSIHTPHVQYQYTCPVSSRKISFWYTFYGQVGRSLHESTLFVIIWADAMDCQLDIMIVPDAFLSSYMYVVPNSLVTRADTKADDAETFEGGRREESGA